MCCLERSVLLAVVFSHWILGSMASIMCSDWLGRVLSTSLLLPCMCAVGPDPLWLCAGITTCYSQCNLEQCGIPDTQDTFGLLICITQLPFPSVVVIQSSSVASVDACVLPNPSMEVCSPASSVGSTEQSSSQPRSGFILHSQTCQRRTCQTGLRLT